MNFDYNEKLESKNMIDGIDFTSQDPCIWNVYPPGSSGDLLASIINCHYSQTASDYFGINKHGKVIFRPSDYKITNLRMKSNQPLFDEQYFFDIATSLGNRNMNYSMCDQFIFSCHAYQDLHISRLLEKFPKCKIIRTYLKDTYGSAITAFMHSLKNRNILIDPKFGTNHVFHTAQISHPNVFNIPFGVLFEKNSYYQWYDEIINFLSLNARLICFDYVEYYISKQHPKIKNSLIEYGRRS